MYSLRMRRVFRLVVTGFCMGAADIVPGVSGGTMAFILGIYEELVDTIRRYGSSELWRPLVRADVKTVVQKSNWVFLLSVVSGIFIAVLSLSQLLENLLRDHPTYIWSFFFGLVLASAIVVSRKITKMSLSIAVSLLAGAVVAYIIVGLVPVRTPEEPWFLILSGAIAICAMILPGISGSFLLVILGKYEFILQAVNSRDFTSLAYVAIGAGGGLLGFSHVLSWLLHKYHDVTIAFLTGLMIGSLEKIWPWKLDNQNMIPELSSDLTFGLGLMVLGCVSVILLEKIADAHD